MKYDDFDHNLYKQTKDEVLWLLSYKNKLKMKYDDFYKN